MSTIDGLASGLDTTTIIKQLMAIERKPEDALKARRLQAQSAGTELAGIRSDVSNLGTLASSFRTAAAWNAMKATSSNPTAVTATATTAGATGALSFKVTSLATAASRYSTQIFPATDSPAGPGGASLFSASGYEPLGFASMTGSGFGAGNVEIQVFQESTAARLDSVVNIPVVPIQVDNTNDGIDISVDGTRFSISLAQGSYNSLGELTSALNDALQSDPGTAGITASITPDNRIELNSGAEGSAHSLSMNGGTALDLLGFSAGDSAVGGDAIVRVNGVDNTVTDATDGTQVTLNDGNGGTINATLGGGLRAGSATATVTSTGNGTLADLVSAVNAADLGYKATAVNVGNGYRLQLTATSTGAASAFTPDQTLFGSMAFTTLSAGTDASITVQGDNPYTITSATNTFTGLLPGTDVTVSATTDSAVTVSTSRDYDAMTAKVDDLVTKLNALINRVAKSTSNDPGADQPSVLQGNLEARKVADALRSALSLPVDSSSFTSVGVVGIELSRDGTITFDKAKFADALKADPAQVGNLFAGATGSGNQGALDRILDAVDKATKSPDGYLYTASESNSKRIDDYGKQIDDYEKRMTDKEAQLRRTYANLEVALNNLKKQSSNLVAQLGGGGN